MTHIELGNEVRDQVTGFTGIAIARYEYLNKCVRFEIQSRKLNKDGEMAEAKAFDQEQLVVVGPGLAPPEKEPTGGSRPSPARRAVPSRR